MATAIDGVTFWYIYNCPSDSLYTIGDFDLFFFEFPTITLWITLW